MPYIISAECMDCGVCVTMCPKSAIFESDRGFAIRGDRCDQCGTCAPYCPARAIVRRDRFSVSNNRTARRVIGSVSGGA
jgi:MinD superfamily P-loop ATPase